MNLEVMTMNGYSSFPKLQGWNLTIRWFSAISRTLFDDGFYSSAELHSADSTTDWAVNRLRKLDKMLRARRAV